jgi:hypothetical protein
MATHLRNSSCTIPDGAAQVDPETENTLYEGRSTQDKKNIKQWIGWSVKLAATATTLPRPTSLQSTDFRTSSAERKNGIAYGHWSHVMAEMWELGAYYEDNLSECMSGGTSAHSRSMMVVVAIGIPGSRLR